MSLPKVKVPVFSLNLPSTGQKIDYRAFSVKEEKLLLMAKEDTSPTGFVNAIKQVINNCVLTPNVDVNKFAIFDLELFFLRLRSKSVGSLVEVAVNDPDGNSYKVQIDLDNVEVKKDPEHTHKFILDEGTGIGVIMRYPTIEAATSVTPDSEEVNAEAVFDMIKQCIESVYDKSSVYKMKEQKDEEIQEWIDSLSAQHLHQIQTFFDTMPSLRHEVKYNKKDGTIGVAVLEGIKDFFQ